MMAPTLVLEPDGGVTALGSGGSNRLRTAILQVLVRLLDFGHDAQTAVRAPRIHVENGIIHAEPGFAGDAAALLSPDLGRVKSWPEPNMFFGGVHIAQGHSARAQFTGAGDPRRGGVSVLI